MTTILIMLLNGPNYATWKVQCKLALMKEGLWNFVTGDENAPENQGEQAKYLLRRDRALATIVLSVDATLLYLLGPDPEHPPVVWKKLADQFQKKKWTNKLALRRELYNLKLKDGQSLQKHVKMLTKIFDELSYIGDPLDQENEVVHLLASLPESYDMLVTALETSPEVPKLETVTERLLQEETEQREKEYYRNESYDVKTLNIQERFKSPTFAVGLGTSKGNAECYWKVLERIKTTKQRVTLTKAVKITEDVCYQKKTQMTKERRLLVWLMNMLYLLTEEATVLLILVRLVTCVIMKNCLIKPLV